MCEECFVREVRRFRHKYEDVTVPDGKTIHTDIQGAYWTETKRIESKHRVISEEKSDEVSARLEQSQELLRRLTQETEFRKRQLELPRNY
jgi:hypothetical protein